LRDHATVPDRLARAEAGLLGARAFLHAAGAETWADAVEGRPSTPRCLAALQLAAVHAVRSAAEATTTAYECAGMSVLFHASALGRCWRDAHAITQHVMVSSLSYAEAGVALHPA
jgi:alkylation response protein AidB-like acyl-CoA dehydrogenase